MGQHFKPPSKLERGPICSSAPSFKASAHQPFLSLTFFACLECVCVCESVYDVTSSVPKMYLVFTVLKSCHSRFSFSLRNMQGALRRQQTLFLSPSFNIKRFFFVIYIYLGNISTNYVHSVLEKCVCYAFVWSLEARERVAVPGDLQCLLRPAPCSRESGLLCHGVAGGAVCWCCWAMSVSIVCWGLAGEGAWYCPPRPKNCGSFIILSRWGWLNSSRTPWLPH